MRNRKKASFKRVDHTIPTPTPRSAAVPPWEVDTNDPTEKNKTASNAVKTIDGHCTPAHAAYPAVDVTGSSADSKAQNKDDHHRHQ